MYGPSLRNYGVESHMVCQPIIDMSRNVTLVKAIRRIKLGDQIAESGLWGSLQELQDKLLLYAFLYLNFSRKGGRRDGFVKIKPSWNQLHFVSYLIFSDKEE